MAVAHEMVLRAERDVKGKPRNLGGSQKVTSLLVWEMRTCGRVSVRFLHFRGRQWLLMGCMTGYPDFAGVVLLNRFFLGGSSPYKIQSRLLCVHGNPLGVWG